MRGEKREREGWKKIKKRQKLKSFFINTVSIHYRCIYAILWVIHHCLRRQYGGCIINDTECIINVWDYTEIFPNPLLDGYEQG